MTDNAIALFKGAGLPSLDVGQYKQALIRTQQVAAVGGNNPFLRMLKQNGEWVYGANETEVQEGSQWAVNPLSLEIGYVAWNPKGGKPLGKQMRSIFQTPLTPNELPDLGAPWDENIGLKLLCLNGEDKGTEVEYTANSYGGRKAFSDLVAALQKQLDTDQVRIVPVVNLTNTSYKHTQYGTIYNPVFEIVSWMTMQGPAVEEPPTEQTARRGRAPVGGEPDKSAAPDTGLAAGTERGPAPDAPSSVSVQQPVQRTRRRRAAATA